MRGEHPICRSKNETFCFVCARYIRTKSRRKFSENLQNRYKELYGVDNLKNSIFAFSGELTGSSSCSLSSRSIVVLSVILVRKLFSLANELVCSILLTSELSLKPLAIVAHSPICPLIPLLSQTQTIGSCICSTCTTSLYKRNRRFRPAIWSSPDADHEDCFICKVTEEFSYQTL